MIESLMPIKTFIFDLNGTVWRWNTLAPNTENVISRLRKNRKKVYFVTNSAYFSRDQIAQRLNKFGVDAKSTDIVSSGYAAAKYFESEGITAVNLIGGHGLSEEFDLLGIENDADSEHILLSLDRNFNYTKLKEIFDRVQDGAKLYTAGMDRRFYIGDEIFPAEMPMLKAIKEFVDVPILNLGKPSKNMKTWLLEDIFLFPEDTMLVGDDLDTDIVFGNMCGFKTSVMLGGNTTKKQAEDASGESRPDMVLSGMRDILKRL